MRAAVYSFSLRGAELSKKVGELLVSLGYEVQVLEFIDMEHTPKNILIRATKAKGMRPKNALLDRNAVEAFTKELGVCTTLQQLFPDGGNINEY